MSLISSITALNIAIALVLWWPAIYRMVQRKSSADYSLVTMGAVLWLQFTNAGIAMAQGRMAQFWWFSINAVAVAIVVFVIAHYRTEP